MKLPVCCVICASCLQDCDTAFRGSSFCVSHRDALLMTALLALTYSLPPALGFRAFNFTPAALPPAGSTRNDVWMVRCSWLHSMLQSRMLTFCFTI